MYYSSGVSLDFIIHQPISAGESPNIKLSSAKLNRNGGKMNNEKTTEREKRRVIYTSPYDSKPFQLLKLNPDTGRYFPYGKRKSFLGILGSENMFDLDFDEEARKKFNEYKRLKETQAEQFRKRDNIEKVLD